MQDVKTERTPYLFLIHWAEHMIVRLRDTHAYCLPPVVQSSIGDRLMARVFQSTRLGNSLSNLQDKILALGARFCDVSTPFLSNGQR